jgi:hypothetical protein
MKKFKYIFSIAVAATFLSSCTVTMPYAVTENPIGSKKGVSKTSVILGAIQTNGDFGVADAAKNGKIYGGVSTVDMKVSNYILFSTKELIITGE